MKVKAVDFEEKSVQEIENKLIEDHEAATQTQEPVEDTTVISDDSGSSDTPQYSIQENDVLSFIKQKYNKEVDSVEKLFEQQAVEPELPEDVSAFLRYKKETGRGIDDFVKLNKDLDSVDPDSLLFEYYKQTSEGLDDEDIAFDLEARFSYDEDLDDEKEVKKKQIEKKKELNKAKEFFEGMKQKYKAPLETRGLDIPEEEKQLFEAFKGQKEIEKAQAERVEFFKKKTEELFNDNFEGFEFNVDDAKFSYKPGDVQTLRKNQSDLSSFFKSFLDENGYIKDAKAYHRSIAAAMNPDAFAKYFYEQGKASAIDTISKESKNIDMGTVRQAPQSISKSGFKVTALDNDHGNRLVIKPKQ
jgi:hypothetical protein